MKTITVIAGLLLLPVAAACAIPPRLHVDGNKIKDPNGNVIVLRGVSLPDLGFADYYYTGSDMNAAGIIDLVTDTTDDTGISPGWYTKIIRIPIYPPETTSAPATYYWDPANPDDFYDNHLRPIVDYCGQKELYAIVDWHHITNTYEEVADTNVFWTYMSQKFADDTHVLFELFNEPINQVGSDVACWESVRSNMQTWVNIVRTYAPDNLILVGTPQWCQIHSAIPSNPIVDNNVVYVGHVYPAHFTGGVWEINIDVIADCAAIYPVIITEWGFSSSSPEMFDGTISGYGRPFKDFLEENGISNTAWCATYNWNSPMFRNNWKLRCGGSEMGCFTKDWLYETNAGAQTQAMTAAKCKVKAGKTQYATQGPDANDVTKMKDTFVASGTFPSAILKLTSLTHIDVNIVSQNDDELIYSEIIDFTADSVVNDKFSYSYKIPKGAMGAIASLKIDFADRTFAIKTKNLDLTGLGAPLAVNFSFGNGILQGEVNETIINGARKSIPTRLMRLYEDTLVVTKAKAKASTSPSSDSLSVKGDIAAADMVLDTNEPDLATQDVTLTWGDVNATNVQTFVIPEGSFTASKKGHTYKCKKIITDINDCNEGVVTAKIDLDKCTFTVTVKNANGLYVGPGDAEFGISFESGFSAADEYAIPE